MRIVASMMILIMMTSTLAGCTDELELSESVFVNEDDWVGYTFDCYDSCVVDVSVDVDYGPEIDVYVMNSMNYDNFKECDSFYYYEDVSRSGTYGFSGSTSLDSGDYVIVFDNSDCGDTSPPTNGVNDEAGITYTLSVS